MSDLLPPVANLPPEQEAIRAKCFHPTGRFVEFAKDEVEQSIPQRFEKMVRLHPRRLALKSRNYALTYEALNQAANRIAHAILSKEGKQDEPVALFLGSRVALTAAILGVLKTGRIYVLLNSSFPPARVSFILKNSRAGLLVTDSDHLSLATGFARDSLQVINVAELDSRLATGNPAISISPDALTWITYTSGSSGEPKGVVQNHRNVLHLIMTQTNDLHICSRDRLAMLMSAAGDMFLALLNGAAIFPPNTKDNGPGDLGNWLMQEEITVYSSVPSVFRNFANSLRGDEAFSKLRLIRLTGEAVYRRDVEIYRKHFSRNCILVNRLSSTEVPTFRQYFIDDATIITDDVVPVGYAVEGNEVFLIGDDGRKAGVNEVGEIQVKSRHLSPGYWRNPELTQSRFSPVPGEEEKRIFKTGDLGRMSPDGCLVYLGRKDFQVKIRGHRVELAEIERALLSLGQFREVAVVSLEDHPGEQRLVAYVVPVSQTAVTASALRASLSEKLPDYMIPASFVALDAMPVTATGKVDRRALPVPSRTRPELNTIFVAPRTLFEKELAQVWAEILKLDLVGIYDNFFDLGGHSLGATRVVAHVIKTFHVDVPLQALFATPTVAEMAALITEHQAKKLAEQDLHPILAELESLSEDEAVNLLRPGQTIPRRPSSHLAPLSFAQERLWFLNQLEPESPAYNESNITRLRGSLDVPALEKALNQIVERHEVLRTTIAHAGGAPQQLIDCSRSLDLPVIDLRTLKDKERDCEARRLITETVRRPFDLSRDLMLRALVIRLTDQEHMFLLVKHHIASDGWSVGILWQELAALYRGSIAGEMAPLPELPVQYADYAVWQRDSLRGEGLETKLAYWKKQLDNLPTLQLPTDRPRPPVQTLRGARHPMMLSRNLLSEINALCRREGVTLFMTLLAAFQVLLQQYTGQDDIVVGTPIAARDHPELDALIGFFVNSLVLRTDLTGNPTFRELLRRVREVALGAYDHQDVPFEKLVEQLKPERNLSHSPLFQVVLALQNAPGASLKLEGLTSTSVAVDNGTAKFDLTLSLHEEAGELKGWLEYNTDLFDAATTRRMLWHFENLLRGIVANPEQPLSELLLLTHDERQQLLQEWNDTQRRYPKDSTVHELFEAQVERTPDAVAVVFNEEQMTYAELNRDANRLGHYLQTLGVRPGTLVGVCVERSLSMIVALLGILKAGSAYVPLDPAYPKERLAFMLEDTQTPVLLTEQRLLSTLPKHETKIVCLDRDWDRILHESEANLPGRTTAEDLAYVMYTSGSTGRPKGVEVPHRGIVRLICGSEYASFGAQEVFLQLAPMSFDASTFEIWGALLHGGRCVLFPGAIPTLQELDVVLHRHSVTTLWLTASLFNAVIDQAPGALSNIRQLLTGGEALSVPHVRRALSLLPAMEITNSYGPTESTTFTCCYRIPKPFEETRSSVPIGRPIANTKVYILDKHLHPVPVGVRGELHIGGDGLARGYLNETDLTAQKFIADPFNLNSGARLYKTGDLARYLPDGNIEFLGRMDRQIKLRGFRIELGEIESTLAQHPGVSETVLLAQEDNPGDKRLVAYVVPERKCCPTADELNKFLKTKLPGYMVPSVVVFLDRLPLTANGKLDRQALSKPDLSRLGSCNPPAIPRNHVERQLANIWETIVSVRPIGVKDNFFDLGGHSLLAIRMMSQIENVFGKKLPLNALFQAPTIEQLAALLSEEVMLAPWSSLVPLQTGGPKPPFFWVHGEASDVVLPRYLGPHQPLYGFIHQSHDGTPARQTGVEEIAAHYLSEMRSIEPKGPYYLGGYCFGGTVAFEMAQQLRREGQEVTLLVLLVPATPLNCDHFPSTVPNGSGSAVDGEPCGIEIQHHFRNQEMLGPKERIVYILAKTKRKITGTALTLSAPLRKMLKTVTCKIYLKSGYPLPLALRSFYILEIYRRALKKYVPKAYDGALVIFMSEDNPGDSKIWKKLALRGIESQEVAGSHSEVLNEPYLKTWAEELKDQLDRTQSRDGRCVANGKQNIDASNHGTFDSV